MAKVEIELEITGFKLKVRGEREDIPAVTAGLKEQLGGLVDPAKSLALAEGKHTIDVAVDRQVPLDKSTKSRPTNNRAKSGTRTVYEPVAFKHDPVRFGSPQQSWKTAHKSIWLLRVTQELADRPELSGGEIAATFNKQFRQAGKIITHNVNRDLGKLKADRPAPIGEDTTKTPPAWFLTDEGKRRAQELIGEVTTSGSAA